ncbi:hypothetical protein Drose_00950 [Dactylosporangium roseum]|uniref:DUF559 domain-containing protein n=1 Tax=Dactylosporangium roseum TaxID=47989 RepID=A0ABY5Z5I9_9ACTN|nr:hypothetical protein [Dactylosporangium roseum]UWZ36934.1 hypothetical protein Drose_00950 [Dactylosporangium roseum]
MNPGQPDRDRLDAHATAQRGLFTRTQALNCGYSESKIKTKCRTGDWTVVVRDVYADRGLEITPRLRDAAAVLALPGAVLAGPSAARWHRIEVPSTATFVAYPRRIRRRQVHVLHEEPPPTDVVQVDGVATTTLGRTLFDCARLLPDAAATALLTKALEEGWTTMPELAERIRDMTGRHGTPRLVRLIRTVAFGDRSAALQLMVRLLQRAGIWGWQLHEPINDRWGLIGLGDVVFPEAKLVLDLGPGPELGTDDAEPKQEIAARRRERAVRLAAAGWTVTALTWGDLTGHPTEVVAELRACLDRLTPVRW